MTTVMVKGKPIKLDYVADLEPIGKAGVRGPFYRVTLDGEELVSSGVTASLDACRVLAAKGMTGKIGFRHSDGMIGLVTSIEAGSRLTVSESSGSPRFRKWQPYSGHK